VGDEGRAARTSFDAGSRERFWIAPAALPQMETCSSAPCKELRDRSACGRRHARTLLRIGEHADKLRDEELFADDCDRADVVAHVVHHADNSRADLPRADWSSGVRDNRRRPVSRGVGLEHQARHKGRRSCTLALA
jgi:hypothetical protein